MCPGLRNRTPSLHPSLRSGAGRFADRAEPGTPEGRGHPTCSNLRSGPVPGGHARRQSAGFVRSGVVGRPTTSGCRAVAARPRVPLPSWPASQGTLPRTRREPAVEDPMRSGAGGPAGREYATRAPSFGSTVHAANGRRNRLRRARTRRFGVFPPRRPPRWQPRAGRLAPHGSLAESRVQVGARSPGVTAGSAFAWAPARTPEELVEDPLVTVRMLDVAPQPTRRSLFGGARETAAPSGAGAPGRVNWREVLARRAGRKAARPEIGKGRSTAVRRGDAGPAGASEPVRTATRGKVLRHCVTRLAEATAASVGDPER